MNLNTIGEILRFYREKYNFKQSDVCNGICSISTLSRIENGNKAADSLILECLLGRIGKEVLQFEMILNDYDYSLWMLRKQIEREFVRNDKRLTEKILNIYQEQMPQNENVHKQFYMYYKLQILENISLEEKCKMGIEALEYTNSINNHMYIYNVIEIKLILFLIHSKYEAWKDIDIKKTLLRILQFVQKVYTGRQKEQISIKILMEIIQQEQMKKRFSYVINYVDKAIEFISQSRTMENVAELHFIKAKAIEKAYHECEWENEEENCKRECMMSYYTFDIMENEQKKQEVQKFCEEQLGWRITK